jgi:hypothetical protein
MPGVPPGITLTLPGVPPGEVGSKKSILKTWAVNSRGRRRLPTLLLPGIPPGITLVLPGVPPGRQGDKRYQHVLLVHTIVLTGRGLQTEFSSSSYAHFSEAEEI